MENSSKIGIFFFVICLCGTVTCRSMPPVRHYTLDRLNIKRTELKQMCDAKGENFYQDINDKFITFTLYLTERFMAWKKEINPTDDVYKMVQERCIKDTILQDILKKFIGSAQLCMEDKDRLSDDKLQAMTTRLMELFCAQYTDSHAFSSDEGCLDLVTNAAIDTCKEKYKIGQFIPLPFIYSNKECNKYQKYSECGLEAMKSCKDATKTAVEAANSIVFHTFFGCHNISVIPEKVTMNRSLVEFDDFVRFNLTIAELVEMCHLNAKISFEVIQMSLSMNLVVFVKQYLATFLKTKFFSITDTLQLDSLIQDSYYNNPTVIAALENIYETVELCIPDNERFTVEEKAKVLRQSLDNICASVKTGVRIHAMDKECFQDLSTLLEMSLCQGHSKTKIFNYNSIPLPFKLTPAECNEINEFEECQLNIMKDCKSWTKFEIQSRFNDANKFFGCTLKPVNNSLINNAVVWGL